MGGCEGKYRSYFECGPGGTNTGRTGEGHLLTIIRLPGRGEIIIHNFISQYASHGGGVNGRGWMGNCNIATNVMVSR